MSGATALDELTDVEALTPRLAGRGLSRPAAAEKAQLFAASAKTLIQIGLSKDAPARAFFVPGRIEVLGKHTDYAGGRSIVAATERGFCMVSVDRDNATVRIVADDVGQTSEFEIDPELAPTVGHWSNYAMTVARRLARNFSTPLRGADIAFRSDLPIAAGMSSSSALMVAGFLVLAGVNELDKTNEYRSNIDTAESLAGYLGTVENGQSFRDLPGDKGVGTFGGSEDHTAMLCCEPGKLSQYSYCPVRFERHIELPEKYVFAIACSGVVAEKTGSAREKYNRASRLASAAVEAWNKATGRDDAHLAAAIASEADAVNRIRSALAEAEGSEFSGEQLLQRFEQFLAESEQIIPAAGDALTSGDVEEFGWHVARSQGLTETLLGNQVPETILLARTARQLGAAAASAFGAGFGGSVWALVESDSAERFIKDWASRYEKAFQQPAANARFFLSRPGPAAFAL